MAPVVEWGCLREQGFDHEAPFVLQVNSALAALVRVSNESWSPRGGSCLGRDRLP